MDASTPPAVACESSSCDVCGYPRIGLPEGALCPECGEPPPAPTSAPTNAPVRRDRSARRSADGPVDARTDGQLAHVRAVALGLLLLVVSSISAFSVTLIMDVGPLTIPSINVPAPKLHAAAFVQRSIGGRPGPWGVSGTNAALLAVLAIWLITTPRSLTADEESAISLRRLTRWTCVVTVGGALGLLLSGVETQIYRSGDSVAGWIALMVLFCELPANGLLYAYMARLSAECGARRASAALDRCAWGVPIVTGLAGAIIVYAAVQHSARVSSTWPASARVGAGIYAAAAVGVGAGATAGVLRLLVATWSLAFGTWPARLAAMTGRVPRGVRSVIDAVRAEPARWAVLAGLFLWGYQYRDVVATGLASPSREGLLGHVPMLDFPGPKVPLAVFAGATAQRYSWRYEDTVTAALLILAAVWLITWPDVRGLRRAHAVRIRRVILALSGLAFAAGAVRQGGVIELTRHPRVAAFLLTGLSSVATALVYLRLSGVAAVWGRRDLARRLAAFGLAAAALDLVPLGAFAFNPHDHQRSFAYGLVCAAQVAVVFALTFYCVGTLARLGWVLATERAPARRFDAGLADDFDKITADRPVPSSKRAGADAIVVRPADAPAIL